MLHTLSAMEQENEAAGTSKTSETGLGTLLATDKLLSQLKSLALAVHLLIEKHNHASFWAPYIKTLPVTYGTCLYFTLDELKALQGSPTFHSAIQVITNVSKHYSYVFDLLENNSHIMHVANFTWEEFIWAMSAVMSRQNNIPLTPLNDKQPQALHQLSRQQEFALIPAWDMCNHDNGKITTFYDINSECTECYATRNFKKGEQIYIFYGPRGNSELLLHSGFVFDNNNYDSLSVRMRLPDTTNVCLKEKFTLLHLCGFKMDKSFSLYNNFVPGELLAFLRLSAMNEEEVKVALLALQKPQNNKEKEEDTKDQKEESTKFDPFRKYSERNEIAALAILANKCTQLLKAYPTSIEEDKKLLGGELSANMRSVVLLRLKEKELLHNIIRMASSGHMSTQPPPASASSSSTSSTAGSASSPSSPSSSSKNGAPSATASTGSKKKKRNRNRNKKKTDASASSSAPATNQQ
ncbi:Histone-lysine N-methyltransferase setd3 [Balamuthia mandrillaris]